MSASLSILVNADPTTSRFDAFVRTQMEDPARWARRLHAPVADAEEWLQDSLACLARALGDVPEACWGAWLQQAMVFRKLTHRRRNGREAEQETNIRLLLYEGREGASPETEMHQQECERELRVLIKALPRSQRVIAHAYLIDGVSIKEVAEQLGLSENTAKDRLRLARHAMAEAWNRARAKERRQSILPAFMAAVAALAAFFVAVWRRLFGRWLRHTGPVAAVAAAVAVVISRDEWPSPLPAHTATAAASSAVDVRQTEAPAPASAQPSARAQSVAAPSSSGSAEPATRRAPARGQAPAHAQSKNNQGTETADMLLFNASAAIQARDFAAARTYLAVYRVNYPHNPFPSRYAKLLADASKP